MLHNLLKEYQQSGNFIRVGVVGSGQMGEGLVCQMEMMYGMRAFAIADIIPGRASQVYQSANVPAEQVIETDDIGLAAQAIAEGKRVATTNSSLLAKLPNLDILVCWQLLPSISFKSNEHFAGLIAVHP